MKKLSFFLCIFIFASGISAQIPGEPINTFNAGKYSNGPISKILHLSDGNFLLCGAFTTYDQYPRNGLVKVNPDLTIDLSFDAGETADYLLPYFTTKIESLAEQEDDKILVGGSFESYNNDDTRTNLVRLNADGSLDETFISYFDVGEPPYTESFTYIKDIQVQEDGKILVGGLMGKYNGVSLSSGIVRLNTDGTRDETFLATMSIGVGVGQATGIRLLSSDRILVSGYFDKVNGINRSGMVALNTDGSVIIGFEFTGSTSVPDFELNADGSIMTAYNITTGYSTTSAVKKVFANGSNDVSFPTVYTSGFITDLEVNPDGSILVGGNFLYVNDIARNYVARITASGELDTDFDPAGGPQGKINLGSVPSPIFDLQLVPGGNLIVVGDFSTFDFLTSNNITVLNSTGGVSEMFDLDNGANLLIKRTAVQPDGKIIAAGDFTNFSSSLNSGVVRLNIDGTVDESFHCEVNFDLYERVADIALQPDGKILVAGKLSMINGVPVFQIARLLSDGSLDPDFMIPESSSDINSIETILLQGDGKIIIGGDFSTINGASRKNIARLNADGTVDISFSTGSGFNGIVYCLAQQDDGKIIAGGAFKKYQSTILHGLARLHSNGELDVSFTNLALDNGFYVYSVAIQPDGKIVMAGEFENAGGINMDNIVRRNADGTHDLTFIGPSDALFQLADIELLADNTILAGGDFSEFEGTEVQGIVNLNADGSLNTGFYLNLVNYRDEYITDITLNADGDIFICGALKEFGFTTKNHIAKLHGTETDCVTPTGLYANELTSSSAKVHWNIVPLAIKYTIQYKPLGTTTWSKKSSVSNFKTLNSLLSNTTYEFRVRTLCEEGPTSYSSIEQFTTLPLKEGELQNSEQVIMSVYPNPTNSVLFIETGNLTDQIQIEITNMFSKKMLQFSASASETVQVDVSQFPAGVYVVNIFAEDQSSTEKFIKL